MNIQMAVTGARLAYVAVPVTEKLTRHIATPVKGKGIQFKEKVIDPTADPSYLVYFPRGHVIRLTQKQMKTYRHDGKPLSRKPKIVNMQGLNDPNSPLGKIMSAQDDSERAAGFKDLERYGIQLATAKTGPNVLTVKAPKPVNPEDEED